MDDTMHDANERAVDQSDFTCTPAFRTMAVRLLRETRCSAAELGSAIDVHPDTLDSWARTGDANCKDGGNRNTQGPEKQANNLRIELERLKQQRDRMRNSDGAAAGELSNPARASAVPEKSLVSAGTLIEMRDIILASRSLVLGIFLAVLLVGITHVMIADPVYRAYGLLEVKEAETDLGVIDDLPRIFRETAPVNAEIEMLQSRAVLKQVVDNLGLTVKVQPVYFPVIGAAIARRMPSTGLEEPWFALSGYAWGGESIKIESFRVPANQLGQEFTIVAKGNGRYQLFDPEGKRLLEGAIGKFESTEISDGGLLTLFVSELKAKPETRFEIIKQTQLERITAIQEALTVREKGDRTRLLEIICDWADLENITDITDEIVNVYLKQNAERKSGEINETIEFLESQLIPLKDEMQKHEATLNDFRLKQGVNDLSNDSKIILQKIVSVDGQLSRLKEERQQLIQKFTPQHSRIIALDNQIATLQRVLTNLNWRVKRLPDTQQEVLRLTRDVEIDADLYDFTLSRLQKLKMINAGPVGNVSIVDVPAASKTPVKPQIGPMLVLYIILGFVLATAATFLRKALHAEVDDPEILEKRLGYPVYAIVPHSKKQDKLSKSANGTVKPALLVESNSNDPASESIRSLRTSLDFAFIDAKNNILLVTGPGPDIGKSFISANLGAALASTGARVLLIDGDLRKGQLHKSLGTPRGPGLSDVISRSCRIRAAVYNTSIQSLWIMPSGICPPNPSELLAHPRFGSALDLLRHHFDHVIIDSPPILPVTDAVIIGRLAGSTFLVVKAGMHTLRTIEESVKRLTQANASMRGFVFNDLPIASNYYGYGKYYGYGSSYSSA